MTNDQPKEFVHQPFAWLNVDKLQADSEAYFHDLGLISSSSILRPLGRWLAKPAAWRAQLIPRSLLRGALITLQF